MAPSSDNGSHGLRHAGDDAFQLTVDYLKQEVVDPLRGLGRFLYMGIAGSFFLAFGLLLVLLGVLRLLQTETGTALTGDWSWVPYAVVVILGIVVIGVAALRISAGPGQRKLPEVIARRESRETEAQAQAQAQEGTN
jgi:Putative Actinobacterial Holin-X, holin superfamily III